VNIAAAFESLDGNAALLDSEGKLVAVNEAWVFFGNNNGGSSKARPISCIDCPTFHRLQILFFSTAEKPNRFTDSIQHHL
jgi:hypothetical protein